MKLANHRAWLPTNLLDAAACWGEAASTSASRMTQLKSPPTIRLDCVPVVMLSRYSPMKKPSRCCAVHGAYTATTARRWPQGASHDTLSTLPDGDWCSTTGSSPGAINRCAIRIPTPPAARCPCSAWLLKNAAPTHGLPGPAPSRTQPWPWLSLVVWVSDSSTTA